MSSGNPQFFFDFQRKSAVDFVHIAILPPKPDCRLAIFQELRYNSISEHAPPNWGYARQISAGTEVSENGTI
jgi:hypothetical protein